MEVGTDEKVCPYFLLVVLRGICYYWLFCFFYLMLLTNMSLSLRVCPYRKKSLANWIFILGGCLPILKAYRMIHTPFFFNIGTTTCFAVLSP